MGNTFFAATTRSFSYRYKCKAKLLINFGSRDSFRILWDVLRAYIMGIN